MNNNERNLYTNDLYKKMFTDYPDIVTIDDMRIMLGGKNRKLGITTAYNLLKQKKIFSRKVGREYKIPKISIIDYLLKQNVI